MAIQMRLDGQAASAHTDAVRGSGYSSRQRTGSPHARHTLMSAWQPIPAHESSNTHELVVHVHRPLGVAWSTPAPRRACSKWCKSSSSSR
eukprot:2988493-Prymnesium_polylepis.1